MPTKQHTFQRPYTDKKYVNPNKTVTCADAGEMGVRNGGKRKKTPNLLRVPKGETKFWTGEVMPLGLYLQLRPLTLRTLEALSLPQANSACSEDKLSEFTPQIQTGEFSRWAEKEYECFHEVEKEDAALK